jgi:putative ABC transport system permease protein
MLDSLLSDLRFAVRLLRKSPGFTFVAVTTLALGIGANTAIFSVVDHVLLRPLSYRDAGRLYAVHEVIPKLVQIAPRVPVNAMHFREWRREIRSFERMALIGGQSMNLIGAGEPERLAAARVSPSLFPMLGIRPQLGRTFADEEDQPGRDAVVVIDDALWKRRFGGDPSIVGRKIVLDGRPYDVVGVLPPDFRFPKIADLYAMTVDDARPSIWKPFAVKESELGSLGDFNYACIVALKPGTSPEQATAEMNGVLQAISRGFPEKIELFASLVPLQQQITGRSQTGLQLLLGAVGVVLLVGCVNIANLLLARAAARRRELAVRAAIGAGGGRLMRQMLVESLALSLAGGAAGIAVAFAAVQAITRSAPLDLPRLEEVQVDTRVLLFTLGVTVAAGLLFGLLPAWRFSRADPHDAMKANARGSTSSARAARLRLTLVGAEVALSALCLVVAALLAHSFLRLVNVDAGFDPTRVTAVELNLPESRYGDLAKRTAFVRAVLDDVRTLPGVAGVGVVNQLPLGGEGGNNVVAPEGYTGPLTERPLADIREVNPEYFAVMTIPRRGGRLFAERDRDRRVVVVSAAAAERLWPGQDAVGKRLQIGGADTPLAEVVGVVGDVRSASLAQAPMMTVYQPYWQRFRYQAQLVIRTAAEEAAVTGAVRAAIRRIDPELPVPAFRTMNELVSLSVAQRRFQTTLVLLFGVVAALLASLGIYGVVSQSVAERTNELGIRLALGARPDAIRWLVLRHTLIPVSVGLVAGVAASGAAGRLLGGLLYGISAADPISIGGAVAMLASVAIVAALLPARRATRVDPVVALRED